MILWASMSPPKFPVSDQQPGARFIQVGQYYVMYVDAVPTLSEITAMMEPTAEQADEVETRLTEPTLSQITELNAAQKESLLNLVLANAVKDNPSLLRRAKKSWPGVGGDR